MRRREIEVAQRVEDRDEVMRTHRNLYARALVRDKRYAALLINRQSLIDAPAPFLKIQLRTKGHECGRVNVRVNLVIRVKEARYRARCLSPTVRNCSLLSAPSFAPPM